MICNCSGLIDLKSLRYVFQVARAAESYINAILIRGTDLPHLPPEVRQLNNGGLLDVGFGEGGSQA